MAAIVFPTSPTTNQVYTANGTTWIWDGTTWNSLVPSPSVAWVGGTLDSGNASNNNGKATSTSTIAPGLPSPYGNTGAIIGSNGSQWVINPPTVTVNSLVARSLTANATGVTFPDSTVQTTAFGNNMLGQAFTASGNFIPDANVTKVKVTLCGGGGGGGGASSGGSASNGGTGGTSSFGTLLSQTGAIGGGGALQPVPTGPSAVNGGTPGGTYAQNSYCLPYNVTKSIQYGAGGSGGIGACPIPIDGGGGSPSNLVIGYFTVTPGTTYTVTIGAGGTGGGNNGGSSGIAGTSGYVLVEW